MATSDDKGRRVSVALPTIQESDEELKDVLDGVHRSTRRKRQESNRTPTKKTDNEKAPGSGSRQRTPRHCAEQAREKLATLFNQGDKHGRSMYAVSESGSEDSSDSYLPIVEEEVMPKGECKYALFFTVT